MKDKKVSESVKKRYSQIAKQEQKSCCSSCSCGTDMMSYAEDIGYQGDDLKQIPEEAILGLGCGNPVAIADLKEGEVVLDLGSGAGIDVFLAANKVGASGKVIGVDMTEEMVAKAQDIAKSQGYNNVEFRLGEIETLPLGDKSVDAVISNCVINLSADKSRVFEEAYRVLKPKGRLMVSDIVSERPLPDALKSDPDAWSCCVGGALEQKDYLNKIEQAGFKQVQVLSEKRFYVEFGDNGQKECLISLTVKASKPEV